MEKKQVYLSLGGNEGQVLSRMHSALFHLSCDKNVCSFRFAHFYQTVPDQVETSSMFINTVCSFQTHLGPYEVFEMTQAIEIQLGKVKKPKNAPRPIDIDLLFYDDHRDQKNDLEIPHPRWQERLFVLIPLYDLTDEIVLMGKEGEERYFLIDLIQPLLSQTPHAVSLVEKNPWLQ